MKEYISNLIKSEITALDEKAKRDYKAEYKKFQSSTKAKKYRAELNKYNRQKGTYGNGDKKDASHKGGKIVGFESQSKNRGRAEKSRLKKEDLKRLVKTYGVERVLEACQKGYMTHPTRKTKIMFGKRYRNCVKKEDTLPSPSRKMINKMKKKGNTSVPYGSGYKKVNETPYELGGMKVYSKSDGLKKVKSMQKTAGAKIYKVTKTKTKLYGKHPVTMYNLHTKNKNHSTNSNPYGLDMMKGVYLIPIKESVNEYTYGVGDIVKDINPTCPHNGAMGKVKSVSPKSVVFVVMNKGKNYQPGDVLDKTHDQMKKMEEGVYEKNKGKTLYGKDLVNYFVKRFKYSTRDATVVANKLKDVGFKVPKVLPKYESVNEISNSEAKTLLKQLGGRRFMMMVGAKGIARDKDGLHMKIGRNSKSISHVVIDYNRGKDLYDMKFLRVRKSGSQMKVKTIKHVKDIYADMLHDTFEKHTGLYTRM